MIYLIVTIRKRRMMHTLKRRKLVIRIVEALPPFFTVTYHGILLKYIILHKKILHFYVLTIYHYLYVFKCSVLYVCTRITSYC